MQVRVPERLIAQCDTGMLVVWLAHLGCPCLRRDKCDQKDRGGERQEHHVAICEHRRCAVGDAGYTQGKAPALGKRKARVANELLDEHSVVIYLCPVPWCFTSCARRSSIPHATGLAAFVMPRYQICSADVVYERNFHAIICQTNVLMGMVMHVRVSRTCSCWVGLGAVSTDWARVRADTMYMEGKAGASAAFVSTAA